MTKAFDASALTNDELRAAVTEAKARLAHIETCDHCAETHQSNLAETRNYLTWVQGYNERAAQAGYVVGSSGIIHSWDCPSILSLIRSVLRLAEAYAGDGDMRARGFELQLPGITTVEMARELLRRPTPKRRTCRTCCPRPVAARRPALCGGHIPNGIPRSSASTDLRANLGRVMLGDMPQPRGRVLLGQ